MFAPCFSIGIRARSLNFIAVIVISSWIWLCTHTLPSKAFGELISLCAFCKSSNIFHFIADTQTQEAQEVGAELGVWHSVMGRSSRAGAWEGCVCAREGHARPGPKGAQANNICQCWQYFTPEWSVASGCPQFTAQCLAKGPEDLKKPHKSFYTWGQKKSCLLATLTILG